MGFICQVIGPEFFFVAQIELLLSGHRQWPLRGRSTTGSAFVDTVQAAMSLRTTSRAVPYAKSMPVPTQKRYYPYGTYGKILLAVLRWCCQTHQFHLLSSNQFRLLPSGPPAQSPFAIPALSRPSSGTLPSQPLRWPSCGARAPLSPPLWPARLQLTLTLARG